MKKNVTFERNVKKQLLNETWKTVGTKWNKIKKRIVDTVAKVTRNMFTNTWWELHRRLEFHQENKGMHVGVLGDEASCYNRNAARRRHNQLRWYRQWVSLSWGTNSLRLLRLPQPRRRQQVLHRYLPFSECLSDGGDCPHLSSETKNIPWRDEDIRIFINLCLTLRHLLASNKIAWAPCKATKANTKLNKGLQPIRECMQRGHSRGLEC